MRVVILEDEKSAASNLKLLLREVDETIQVDKVLDTVSNAIEYFSEDNDIDLAFFDIHLADGNSFEIFNQIQVDIPIIFTTAYDEYALRAFKVNSIDYLLKPIDEDELNQAIQKFKSSVRKSSSTAVDLKSVLQELGVKSKAYKSTFLIRNRDKFIPLDVLDIAYFLIDSGIVKAITFDGKSAIIDEKLEDIQSCLDPDLFFRVNRQFIVQKSAISSLSVYFNGKLIMNVVPESGTRIIVSKAKAPVLKEWMG